MLSIPFDPKKAGTYFFQILLPVVAAILPAFLAELNLPLMPRITTTSEQLLGLFAFFMWLVLAINAHRELAKHPSPSIETLIVIILPFLVSSFFLFLVVEYANQSWDYEQYEDAFKSIVMGKNPYRNMRYLYPPVFAQAMASLYLFAERSLSFMGVQLWLFVFYIHQCLMYFLANLAYQLSCRFASRIGFSELTGALLVSGLFLFNYPLIRTLHLSQVNLYVLDAILFALLTLHTSPILSGAALGFGGLIKIYPFVLAAPLFLAKKWKAVFGVALGTGIIILLQTRFGRDLTLWQQFIQFYLSFPFERESSLWFRNSSLLSFIRNLVHFTGMPENMTLILFAGVALGIVAWMVVRFNQRRRNPFGGGNADVPYQDFGHLIDFSILTLLIAPSAWDHHYIIAIPLALWAVALCWKEKPVWLVIGLASVFALPPFDVFPFSYVRPLGIIILMILAAPTSRPAAYTAHKDAVAILESKSV